VFNDHVESMDSCFVMRHASTNLLRADSNEFVIGNNKPKLTCQLKKKGGGVPVRSLTPVGQNALAFSVCKGKEK